MPLASQSKKSHEVLSVPDETVGGFGLSRDNRTIYFTRGSTEADIWMATLKQGEWGGQGWWDEYGQEGGQGWWVNKINGSESVISHRQEARNARAHA